MKKNAGILVIDDDAGQRKTLSGIMRAKGYETQVAEHGARGLALLKVNPERASCRMTSRRQLEAIHG